MIIEVNQVQANLKKEFEIYFNGQLQYTGRQAGVSEHRPSWLMNLDGSVRFKSKSNKKYIWRNRMLSWLFMLVVAIPMIVFKNVLMSFVCAGVFFIVAIPFIPAISQVCAILNGYDEQEARFSHYVKGLTGYYDVKYQNKEYRLYTIERSHYQYISVYRGSQQIGQINKDLHTVNNKDSYTLYLLDEESELSELLSMFILYFDNYEYGNQGQVFIGTKKNYQWSWSKTDRFYHETWVADHFY